MEKVDTYHHKNLKNALIERAITFLDEEGEAALSLRRLAKECGVSYAAPYAHFESKEHLLDCCRTFVVEQLTDSLKQAVASFEPSNPEALGVLGNAFVDFFHARPSYYSFLFQGSTACKVILTLDEVEGNFPPFEIFRKICLTLTERYRLSANEGLLRLVECWSRVHGACSLMTSSAVVYHGDYKDCL